MCCACSGGMSCCDMCGGAVLAELLLLLPPPAPLALLLLVCIGSGAAGWCACQPVQIPEPGCAEDGVYVDVCREPVALSCVYVGPVGDRFGLSSLYW